MANIWNGSTAIRRSTELGKSMTIVFHWCESRFQHFFIFFALFIAGFLYSLSYKRPSQIKPIIRSNPDTLNSDYREELNRKIPPHHRTYFQRVVCGVGVDVAYHQHVMGFYVTTASVVIFFLEITWAISLFIQVCIRNDDSLCWSCWSGVLAVTRGWRRAILYLPLSCILAWKPHRLWLSFVAAALLALLSLLHILSSILSRRGSQVNGGPDCVGESLLNTRPESYDRFEDVLVTEVLDDGIPGSTCRIAESDGEM